MTNSVRNVVKSSKLGAVTQCGSHDIFENLYEKSPVGACCYLEKC